MLKGGRCGTVFRPSAASSLFLHRLRASCCVLVSRHGTAHHTGSTFYVGICVRAPVSERRFSSKSLFQILAPVCSIPSCLQVPPKSFNSFFFFPFLCSSFLRTDTNFESPTRPYPSTHSDRPLCRVWLATGLHISQLV